MNICDGDEKKKCLKKKIYISYKTLPSYLDGQTAIVIIWKHSSNPSPIKAYGKAGHDLSLVDVTGNGPEEVRILLSVTKAGTTSKVADLKREMQINII